MPPLHCMTLPFFRAVPTAHAFNCISVTLLPHAIRHAALRTSPPRRRKVVFCASPGVRAFSTAPEIFIIRFLGFSAIREDLYSSHTHAHATRICTYTGHTVQCRRGLRCPVWALAFGPTLCYIVSRVSSQQVHRCRMLYALSMHATYLCVLRPHPTPGSLRRWLSGSHADGDAL